MITERMRKEAVWALNRKCTGADERKALLAVLSDTPRPGLSIPHALSQIAEGKAMSVVASDMGVEPQRIREMLLRLAYVFDDCEYDKGRDDSQPMQEVEP